MGQAKRRGTFEQRQAASMERRRQQDEERRAKREAEMESYRQTPEYKAAYSGREQTRMRGGFASMTIVAAALAATMSHRKY